MSEVKRTVSPTDILWVTADVEVRHLPEAIHAVY